MITKIAVSSKLNGNYRVKVTFNNNPANYELFEDVKASSKAEAEALILSSYPEEERPLDEMPEPTEGFDGPTPVLPLTHLETWSDKLVEDQLFDAVDVVGEVDVERINALEAEMARRERHTADLMLLGQSIDA